MANKIYMFCFLFFIFYPGSHIPKWDKYKCKGLVIQKFAENAPCFFRKSGCLGFKYCHKSSRGQSQH